MNKSVKKLFWASMASAVMMVALSCGKDNPTPDDKPDEGKPKTETKAYKELWVMPPHAGSSDVNMIFIRWENGKTSYRSYKDGTAVLKYENNEPMLSPDDAVIEKGRDGAAFAADSKDIFKIILDNGAVITAVPLKDASISIYHYSGENVDLDQAKDLANTQVTTGLQNKKIEVLE